MRDLKREQASLPDSSAIDYVESSKEAKLPTRYGDFAITAFREVRKSGGIYEHLAIVNYAKIARLDSEIGTSPCAKDSGTSPTACKKAFASNEPLLRIHSECLTGDALHSLKCDCGAELELALSRIASEGGAVFYLRQEGRGIGLFNKVNAYALQDLGLDTVEANLKLGFKEDERSYEVVGHMLRHYALKSVRLLTNNPDKVEHISEFVEVTRCEILTPRNEFNTHYLDVKKKKLGHLL